MKIKFLYSVSSSALQLHNQEIIIEVDGDPADQYGTPSHAQLWLAEENFRQEFLMRHNPKGNLLQYKAVPADGSGGFFSEYKSVIPA